MGANATCYGPKCPQIQFPGTKCISQVLVVHHRWHGSSKTQFLGHHPVKSLDASVKDLSKGSQNPKFKQLGDLLPSHQRKISIVSGGTPEILSIPTDISSKQREAQHTIIISCRVIRCL